MFKMNIREFTDEEITEISEYMSTQIPQSILPQFFVLTEEPIKKIKVFIAIYRIITSARDFVENQTTKDKLTEFLKYSKDAYDTLYNKYLKYENSDIEFGKQKLKSTLIDNLLIYNDRINFTCNCFLIFAEKQELISTDTVSGVKLEKPEGEDIMDKLSKLVED